MSYAPTIAETTMMTKTPAHPSLAQNVASYTGHQDNPLPMPLHAPNVTGQTIGQFAVNHKPHQHLQGV